MATDNDLEIEAPEVFNAHLLKAIEDCTEGPLKRASDAGAKMIRRRLRESGFSRLILPYKQITDETLTYLPNTDLPVIVEEMEADSPGAKSIPFNDSADTAFYRADKFTIVFCKISTLKVFAQTILRCISSRLAHTPTELLMRAAFNICAFLM